MKCRFVVPKYQRSFSWSDSEINDFWSDIEACYLDSIQNQESSHFFGGIVCVKHSIEATSMSEYELIDGQQRMASFVILVSCLHNWLKEISEKRPKLKIEAEAVMDRTKKYLEWSETINRQKQRGIKLTLTKRDEKFFKKLISGEDVQEESKARESNKRLWAADSLLSKKIREQEKGKGSNVLKRIDKLIEVLDTRCKVLLMETENKNDAYKLFQVLNDRGMSLTEGDLLRATTLEFFDNPKYTKEQEEIEEAWDSILKDTPKDTQDYLDWYFASYIGRAAKRSQRFDDYVDQFFAIKNIKKITSDEAKKIRAQVKDLDIQVDTLRKLCDGI